MDSAETDAAGIRDAVTPQRLARWAVALHLLAHGAHGLVHEQLQVSIADWQTAYVIVVVFVVPLLGAVALVRHRQRVGAVLLFAGAGASFVFETVFHFLLDNPDHVGSVADGSGAFAGTAVLAAGSALCLAGVGAWLLVAHSQGGSRRSAIDSRT